VSRWTKITRYAGAVHILFMASALQRYDEREVSATQEYNVEVLALNHDYIPIYTIVP
jgi:hypothetical protein